MKALLRAVPLLLAAACAAPAEPEVAAPPILVSSTTFADGGDIPVTHTCDGADVPPPLAWERPPAGTAEVAVRVDDPDAPRGTFVHWLVAGLPADATALDGPLPPGAVEGRNDLDQVGWAGPCPPAEDDEHTYRFRVLAVDQPTGLPAGFTADDLERAADGQLLAEGVLTGRYGR